MSALAPRDHHLLLERAHVQVPDAELPAVELQADEQKCPNTSQLRRRDAGLGNRTRFLYFGGEGWNASQSQCSQELR